MACCWCGRTFQPEDRGRLPKWCSANCRQRAWEQRRAAASGLAAVEVIDRVVVRETVTRPRGQEWVEVLGELITQLDSGRFYRRDLPSLQGAVAQLLCSISRRTSL
jgi:hypothetical protein